MARLVDNWAHKLTVPNRLVNRFGNVNSFNMCQYHSLKTRNDDLSLVSSIGQTLTSSRIDQTCSWWLQMEAIFFYLGFLAPKLTFLVQTRKAFLGLSGCQALAQHSKPPAYVATLRPEVHKTSSAFHFPLAPRSYFSLQFPAPLSCSDRDLIGLWDYNLW